MKKKTKLIIICLIVLLVLLFPVRLQFKDGGSKAYRSIVGIYEVKDWNQRGYLEEGYGTIKTGITVKVFGLTLFDNSKITITEE